MPDFRIWHGVCMNIRTVKPKMDVVVVTCSVDMHFSLKDVAVAVPLLLSGVSRTEAKAGCLACSVARDAVDPARVRYSETWSNETAFRRHVQSQDFQRVLAAMDLCCEEPQVVVGNLAGHRGIAYLQHLRDHQETARS